MSVSPKHRKVKALWIDGAPFPFETAVLIEQWLHVEDLPPQPAGWDLELVHSSSITDGPHALRADLEDGGTWEENGIVKFNTSVGDAKGRRTRTNIQQA